MMKNISFVLALIYLNILSVSATLSNDTLLTNRLNSHLSRCPIEKLYLHQDRAIYYAGDTIWLKVYQFISPQAVSASKVVYIDLINEKGKVIAQAKYPITNGQYGGNIRVPNDIPTGHYFLRAYTRWMQNFDTSGIFCREVLIYGVKNSSEKKKLDTSKDIRLHFYPEGGDMIDGLTSKVAFEVLNKGRGMSAKGVVLNSDGDTLLHFHTSFDGKGSFSFLPHKNERYIARLIGSAESFTLPEVRSSGFVLSAKHLNNALRISVSKKEVDTKHAYSLVLHQEGRVLAQLSIDTSKGFNFFDLPLDKLPAGIFTLTLVDESYHAYCERLLFEHFPDILNLKISEKSQEEGGYKKISLDIDSDNSNGTPVKGVFSLAVCESLLEQISERDNLATYYFLSSELKGSVHSPQQYWIGSSSDCLSKIELLLLTQGWCRYSLEDMIKPVFANKYPMEEGLVLSGNIENISKKRLEGATVQAIIRQDTLQRFAIGTLDNEKHFQISNISFNDTTDVVLSVTDKVGHTYPLKLDPQIAFPAVKEGPFILSEDSLYYTRWKMAELPNSPHNIDKQVFNLGEVTVTARKRDEIEKRRLYGDGFVKTSVEVPENSGMGDVRRLLGSIPGVEMIHDGDPKKPEFLYAHIVGSDRGEKATLVLDGYVEHDPEMIYGLEASSIERVEVLRSTLTVFGGFSSRGGVIALYSRPSRGVIKASNKLICKWIGYSQSKEFYHPNLTDSAFFQESKSRNTLYWNPFVETDTNGKVHLSFYVNNGETGRYIIHCEGYSDTGIIGAKALIIDIP